MKTTYTNQTQVRAAFWAAFPELDEAARKRGTRSKRQNTDTRVAFVDFVDSLARSGDITPKLARNVTL